MCNWDFCFVPSSTNIDEQDLQQKLLRYSTLKTRVTFITAYLFIIPTFTNLLQFLCTITETYHDHEFMVIITCEMFPALHLNGHKFAQPVHKISIYDNFVIILTVLLGRIFIISDVNFPASHCVGNAVYIKA